MARKNKTKKEIVSEIQLVQDADRRRALVRDIIFPYLVGMKENIGYSRLFVQSFNSVVTGVFDQMAKKTTVGDLSKDIEEKFKEFFKSRKDEDSKEYNRYITLLEKLKEVSVQDLAYAAELPRYIDGWILQEKAKDSIETVPLDKIMGK